VRNDAGQPITVTEEGHSPLDDNGMPVERGTALHRTTTYAYTVINRRSLLAQVDGPLPNGPTGTPQDSDITRFHHDNDGNRIVGITYPMAMKAQFQYDAEGRLVTHTPIDGVPLQHRMDSRGRTLGWTRGSTNVKVQRDALGRVNRVERNDSSRFDVHYDAMGRAVAASDAHGNRREMKFDSEGRMLEAAWRDANGQAPFDPQRWEYDAAGRSVTGTGGWRASYDDHGRLHSVEDALRRQSRYHYDEFGRLAAHELRLPADASPPVLKTALGSDAGSIVRTQVLFPNHAGEAAGVVAANGARTTSDIDDFGRTVRVSSPDTGVETARYDEANRLLERIDAAGNRTSFQYDLLGRLVSRRTVNPARPDDVEDARWTFHGTLLVQSANRHQSDSYRWDAEHRLSEQTTRLARLDGGSSSHEFVTRYSYDNVGRLSEKRLPDGLVVVHQYDAHGAPARLTLRYPNGKEQPIIDSLKADPAHGLREVTFGNGVVTAYAKDRHGRIAGIVTASKANGESKPLYAQRISYDAGGRITAIERNGAAERYAYDGQDRLLDVRTPHEQRRFAYDEVGNRTAVWQSTTPPAGMSTTAGAGIPQQSLTYEPNSNRLLALLGGQLSATAHPATALTYDATGNPTSVGKRRLVYGVNGRLREAAEFNAVLGRYVYNAAGERVGKQAGGTNTHYLYANNRIVAEADGQGRITAHYFYSGSAPIAKVETGAESRSEPGWTDTQLSALQKLVRGVRAALADADSPIAGRDVAAIRVLYLHTDHMAAPRLATDALRRVVWTASYDAYGLATEQMEVDGDGRVARVALRFPGQYFDEETQYHYNYFRNYDPRLGRFLEPDPIGTAGGTNLYAYAELDPLRRTDPLGLYTEIIRWASSPGLSGSWGHISGNIDGKNYSFGPNGWDTRYPLAKDYAERQRAPGIDREGVGIILNLARHEEDALARCLIGHNDYHPMNNNCGNPFLRCLDELDITYSGNRPQVLPEDVMKIIGTSKRAAGATHYPGTVKLYGYPQNAHHLLGGGNHVPARCDAGDRCRR
jgi:RHS repeat-associated protein